jgi:arylsulfatase A-like enzyme
VRRPTLPWWWLLVPLTACGGTPTTPPPATFGPPATRSVPQEAPTVILISIDTLRPDRLGCYGNQQPTSPNLDRFRENAVLFTSAIAQAPSTLPSHATMLTSLLPEHHGAFFSRRSPLPGDLPTLATLLAAAGYRTAAFTGGGQLAPEFGLARGFEIYGVNEGGASFGSAVGSGLNWLRRDPDHPAFLFLHTYQVHHPYTPDAGLLALFDEGYEGGLPGEISKKLLTGINRGEIAIDERDLTHIIATYDAEIRSVDEAFGELIHGLDDLGMMGNSLIVFTSDHGEEFGEHGVVGWHSHTLYDELLRVPLVIRFPHGRGKGLTVDAQVRLLDLAPTIVAVAGLDAPPSFEGVDLRRVIDGHTPPLPALSQLDLPVGERVMSMRTLHWKLYPRAAMMGNPFSNIEPPFLTRVKNRYQRWRHPYVLFDLENDAGEHIDVLAENFWNSTGLEKLIDRLSTERPTPKPIPTVTVDDTTTEQLEALGYITGGGGDGD